MGPWSDRLRDEFAKHVVVSRASSLAEVLESDSDAVVIATRPDSHFDQALACLKAGKHVFVEKPLATSSAQAFHLTETARDLGLVLFTGHLFLYHPVWLEMKRYALFEGAEALAVRWEKWGDFQHDIFWNLLVQDVALAVNLFGFPSSFKLLECIGFQTVADAVALRLRFPRARSASISITRLIPDPQRRSVVLRTADNTYVWVDDELFRLGDSEYEPIFRAEESALSVECKAFLEDIRTGWATDEDTAVIVTQIIQQLRLFRPRS